MPSNLRSGNVDLDDLLLLRTDYVPNDSGLFTCGRNVTYGNLGLGDTTNRSSPVQVGTLTNWSLVEGGGVGPFMLAVKNNGTLWSWGSNNVGQLGLGDTTNRSSPVQVGTLTNWKIVATGLGIYNTYRPSSLAIKTDGTLWGWGGNNVGMLGLNDATARSSPVQVGALTDWSYVACGEEHTLAVKTNGSLWTWGYNGHGQLGSGTTTSRSSPVQVGTLTNWKIVSGGGLTTLGALSPFSMSTKTDGTLWAWGHNAKGQLGLGNTTNFLSPVQVGALTNWSLVDCGQYHAHAVKTDGTLWSWGFNDVGQLGLGDTTQRLSPVQVGALTNWSVVSAGRNLSFSLAVKTDGTLWSWGNNGAGQLGLGDTTNRSSPVQVGTLTTWKLVNSGADSFAGLKT